MTQSFPPQQTLYDKDGIRITSTLLEYKKVNYRIRDIYKFEITEKKKSGTEGNMEQVIMGILFIILSLLIHNILGVIIGIILLIIGWNNKGTEVEHTLKIITNKAEEIEITKKSKDAINEIKKALEMAIALLSFG